MRCTRRRRPDVTASNDSHETFRAVEIARRLAYDREEPEHSIAWMRWLSPVRQSLIQVLQHERKFLTHPAGESFVVRQCSQTFFHEVPRQA